MYSTVYLSRKMMSRRPGRDTALLKFGRRSLRWRHYISSTSLSVMGSVERALFSPASDGLGDPSEEQ